MESRMDKYYREKPQELSRSKKNQNLYREVYGSYTDLDYLPVSDNSSEIDEERLREIVSSREEYHKNRKIENIEEEKPRVKKEKIKSYDINELIEKARNSKPKVRDKKEEFQSYNFLKTLESQELLKKDIEDALKKEIKEELKEEIKEKNVKSGNTLSLDILSDLKGDTVLIDPVFDTGDKKEDNNSDIPISNEVKNEDDKSFYSGSYKFSSKDFFDDDLSKIEKNHSFIKVLFIVIILAICITGIYFLINFLGNR